jgi:hypothetical protein
MLVISTRPLKFISIYVKLQPFTNREFYLVDPTLYYDYVWRNGQNGAVYDMVNSKSLSQHLRKSVLKLGKAENRTGHLSIRWNTSR